MANYDYWSSDLNTTEDILEHHGVKGQKWGVKNGPPYPIKKPLLDKDNELTDAGIKKYLPEGTLRNASKAINAYKRVYLPYAEKVKNTYDKNTTDKYYRFATSGEPIDEKRKYVTNNMYEVEDYRKYALTGELGADKYDMSEYTYAPIKPISKAKYEDVLKKVTDEYGSQTLKNINLSIKNTIGYDNMVGHAYSAYRALNVDVDKLNNKQLTGASIIDSMFKTYRKELKTIMKKHVNDIATYYKDLGYDAVPDIEDYWYAPYASIILTPVDSLKLINETPIS